MKETKDVISLKIEVKRLQKELKEAKDVISYALEMSSHRGKLIRLEMSSNDDSTSVFEDYLSKQFSSDFYIPVHRGDEE